MRAALALALLGVALAANVASAQTRFAEFGEWMVACDNRRDCRALGFDSRESDSSMGALGIDRAAEAEAAARLWLSFDEAPAESASVEVSADGTSLGRLVIGRSLGARDDERLAFDLHDEAMSRAILDALGRAARLRFAAEGARTPLEISLDGASAALVFVDDRQGRVDTVTALVRRGDRPTSSVPAPPSPEPEPQSRFDADWRPTPTTLPHAVRQRVMQSDDGCDEIEPDDIDHNRAVGRVSADLVLIQVRCLRGGYNDVFRYSLWDERNGSVRHVSFPVPEGVRPPQGHDVLTNAAFDGETLTLTHHHMGRGIGDCGSGGTWRWDGRDFRLTSYRYMPQCHGLAFDHWLILHRSD